MKRLRNLVALLGGIVACQLAFAQAQWQLVWQDEFNGSIGPDWTFETGNGGGGWGNSELEYYRRENATIEGGSLVITAKHEDFGGFHYTSARMKTQGLRNFKYGRIEARIAMPSAAGLWPAFWMLGSDIGSVGWPACGEIDIMEHINDVPNVYGTIHWRDDAGNHASSGGNTPADVRNYHVYAIEWDEQSIRWFVDDHQYFVADASGPNGTSAFHNDFFILLNMAVGGNWPGFDIDLNALPAKMYVDYVRAYQAVDSGAGYSSWSSQNLAGSVIRHKADRGRVDSPDKFAADKGNWKMVPGLAGSGVSFQSQDQARRYLHNQGGEVFLDKDDGSSTFHQEATFFEHPGLANATATSFESASAPGKYMRHKGALLNVTAITTDADKADATFLKEDALSSFAVTLEAESYAVMQGMVAEPCAEGGQDLGYIDAGDWAVWDVNLPTSGTYTVEYRVASQSGGGTIQLEKAGGSTIYGSIAVPATGGWQNWTTISHQVHLDAGQQQIAIKALAGGWNINWLRISR